MSDMFCLRVQDEAQHAHDEPDFAGRSRGVEDLFCNEGCYTSCRKPAPDGITQIFIVNLLPGIGPKAESPHG